MRGFSVGILKDTITRGNETSGGGFAGAVSRFAASGFYAGYIPGAHGTIGSLWGPILSLAVPVSALFFVWCALPALFFIGVWASGRSERYWGPDPGRTVIDEVIGAMAAVMFLPQTQPVIWGGFVLFRVFDIVKPYPIRKLERLPGGWGIMADDLAAGVLANIVLRILMMFIPGMT